MLMYGQENQSLMQLAQAQALPRLPSYAKETTCIQLKDYPIYPALSDPSLMGEVQDDFMKYSTTSHPTCGNLLCNLIVSPGAQGIGDRLGIDSEHWG
jgi:hypothetical protein